MTMVANTRVSGLRSTKDQRPKTEDKFLRRAAFILAVTGCCLGAARDAAAQLDPLLFIKRTQPNVLVVVDTSNRMQRDAIDNSYRDANVYTKTGALYESQSLGITAGNTQTKYRRRYVNLQNIDTGAGGDKFSTDSIDIVGDLEGPAYTNFDWYTRLAIARTGLSTAVTLNQSVVRFGLMRMRQNNPRLGAQGNEGPVSVGDVLQQPVTDDAPGKWKITRPEVDGTNGAIGGPVGALVASDAANANTTILSRLALAVGQVNALTPGGRDAKTTIDAPVDTMLDDAKSEALRLFNADTACRNTVVVLVVGGTRGNTSAGDLAAKATQFLNVGTNHRVPVYVIAIAPRLGTTTPDADVAQLTSIAHNSGGRYFEITPAMINAATPGGAVPEVVSAVNAAVQHAFAAQSDVDTDPDPAVPGDIGPETEFQVTSPIVGTVNLENAVDITNTALVNSVITHPVTGAKIPQRSNILVTSAFALPGFEARMRAFRVYKPVADSTRPSGYKFVADGTRLWVAHTPTTAGRNIYTALPDGRFIKFDAANVADLQPYLFDSDPTGLINYVRGLPLGAVVGSTPAIMDPPSLDPPPDADYPAFSDANKNRRSLIWVGANDGMLHAIDSRLGVEVWAFIPFNLLPKLKELRKGQPVGDFRYFVDSSPKVADVKIAGEWRTYLFMGEGAGGTFYQTFDVTLEGMASLVGPTEDIEANVVGYFADPARVAFKWSFPQYSSFDATISTTATPWGDISAGATAVEKTVGETWSDPAVGQVESPSGKFAVLTGSGFLKYSIQQQANRGGAKAGTTFYLLDAETGDVFDSRTVTSDTLAETVDNCAAVNDCTKLKNALQADPVATGPPDSRFITKAYVGDLDGNIWRFDIKLDAALTPKIPSAAVNLVPTADRSAAHPMFASMATVNVGGTKQYLFQGTGSDLLPSNGVSLQYKLLVILDNGATGTRTAQILLEKTDAVAGDEKVTSFPAVAGDIVFFSTTTYKPTTPCTFVDGSLHAFTFIGGAAYDTNNSGNVTTADSTKVRTTAGTRASAPFISDQHLIIGTGDKIELFGDPEDFNNGVGQVGVRILSWREVR
jgi:hypothetical protein